MGNAEEIIILSDDDDDYLEMSCTEASVIIVETVEEKKTMKEDLVVTYSRRAEVLPHARYDCPIHPFTRATDCEVGAPVADNQLFCDQCFCYICDKLVSTCTVWTHSSVCHCNSHKRSDFWNNQRSCTLLGGLKTFNITLSEMDAHLRHAESMLQSFKQELSMKYLAYLKGTVLTTHSPGLENQPLLNYDYTNVYEFVWSFLDQADKQDDRAAAVMRLGAAEEFVKHFQCARLCVRLWDDILLGSVLKGQNVTGIRKDKGKKDVLMEQGSIVGLRTELLQRQQRYRELCRYLRVVQTDDPKLFQPLQSLLPFFTCLSGDFTLACNSFFPLVNPPAALLTPELFNVYLRVFETATAPQLLVAQPSELCCTKATWEPIKGQVKCLLLVTFQSLGAGPLKYSLCVDAVPLKRAELVRFALRVQTCCPAVSADVSLQGLSIKSPAPSGRSFSLLAHQLSVEIDLNLCVCVCVCVCQVYPDQALLLLVTRALALKILSASLTPALPVLSCFKVFFFFKFVSHF
uniref:Zgc:112980 n=1 Tax=Cynoglossus semilaevis TaxID=244447 RepID=A0A3P8UP47_CYNSE